MPQQNKKKELDRSNTIIKIAFGALGVVLLCIVYLSIEIYKNILISDESQARMSKKIEVTIKDLSTKQDKDKRDILDTINNVEQRLTIQQSNISKQVSELIEITKQQTKR